MPATLFLVPSVLGEGASLDTLPPETLEVLRRLEHLVVETPKQARRFLKHAGITLADRALHIEVLNEHTPQSALPQLLAPALAGADMGVLSDVGCPGVADPGARLVSLAHAHNIRVVPLVGPCAILLALMASGMNGQRFAFHGYLPVDAARRDDAVRTLERDAHRLRQTQIVIETPYRNNRLMHALLATCAADTVLCLATDVTLASQSIVTRTVAQWRLHCSDIDRRPTVFLLAAADAFRPRSDSIRSGDGPPPRRS